MKNLITSLSMRTRVAVLVVAAVAMVWLFVAMNGAIQPAADGSNYGILSFELAGSVDQTQRVLDAWGSEGRAGAERAIKLDYLFLIAYSVLGAVAVGTAAMTAGRHNWVKTEKAGWTYTRLVLVAGLLDTVENTALLYTLNRYESGQIRVAATATADLAASLKFTFIFVAAIYVAGVMVALARERFWRRRRRLVDQ